jgi:hypothetical protein
MFKFTAEKTEKISDSKVPNFYNSNWKVTDGMVNNVETLIAIPVSTKFFKGNNAYFEQGGKWFKFAKPEIVKNKKVDVIN